jgi:hypothetical protein
MMFSEDSSSANFYSVPGGSVDASSVWKPHPSHTDLNNHNSKLSAWTPGTRGNNKGGGEFVYDDASAKAAWNNGGGRQDKSGMHGNNAWSTQGPDSLVGNEALLEQELFNLNMGVKPGDNYGGGPAQWGRQEVNQSTPWEVDSANNMNRGPPFGGPEGGMPPPHGRPFMQQQPPMHFDNGGNHQWRQQQQQQQQQQQWDNDGGFGNKGGASAPDFNGPPFPGAGPMPGQFHGRMNNFVPQQSGFNDRMPFQIRNGPPFHHGHHQPPPQQQPWMENKFGGGGHHQMHHPMANPNAGGRFPFNHPGQQPPPNGPPNMMMPGRPPLLPMQPPHHSHHPPSNVNPVQQNFNMGSFPPTAGSQNDDSMWQDPNGELRKWQRDTGTAVWGDPAKQNASEIRRWLQPPTDSDEENILTPDPLREGKEEIETGWGPPPAPPGQKNAVSAVPQAWAEPPRGPPPPSNFGMPQASNNFHQQVPTGPPANGWGGPPQQQQQQQQPPVNAADWTRSGPPSAAAFQQPPPMGGYDNFGQPIQQQNDQNFQTRRLADKLRMAVSKGLLDMELLVNGAHTFNTPHAANTMKLLNEMFDHVTHLENLEAQIKQIEMNPARKPEFDQLQIKIGVVKAELNDYREKIHAALSQKPGGIIPGNAARVSLADELTSMDHQQPNDLSTPLGNEVGQLW